MPLVINGLRSRHTDTHIPMHKPKQYQKTRSARPKVKILMCAWFKKGKGIKRENYEKNSYIGQKTWKEMIGWKQVEDRAQGLLYISITKF